MRNDTEADVKRDGEAEAQVSALQAQVSTLTAERDALRETARAYLTAHDERRKVSGGSGRIQDAARGRIVAKADAVLIAARKALRAVLSAPPAETTPAPDVAAQYAKLVGDVRAVVDGHPCTSADGKTCCALCDALVQVLDAHE